MIAFEISLNGKLVCIAGADDLGVLNTMITASGKLGKQSIPARPDDLQGEVFYGVGGLTSRKDPRQDVHLKWIDLDPLNVGDTIQVRVIESDTVDKPMKRTKADGKAKKS
jgi:hypothetical protein